MSAQHTPGPWVMTVGEYAYVKGALVNGARKFILQRDHKQDKAEESARILADCRLIAAAPDLLAALEHILAGSLSLPRFAADEARAAIAKALNTPAKPEAEPAGGHEQRST